MSPSGVWMLHKKGRRVKPWSDRYASAKSYLYPRQSQTMASRFDLEPSVVVDFNPSSGILTTRTTQFSPHRDVSIKWNMPWRP